MRKREERERNTTSSPPKRFRGLLPTLWPTELRQETDGKRILHPLPLECFPTESPCLSLFRTNSANFTSPRSTAPSLHRSRCTLAFSYRPERRLGRSTSPSVSLVVRRVLIFLAFVLLRIELPHLLPSRPDLFTLAQYTLEQLCSLRESSPCPASRSPLPESSLRFSLS